MAKPITLLTHQDCKLFVYHTDNQSEAGTGEVFLPTPQKPADHEIEYGYKGHHNGVESDVSSHYLYFKPDPSGSSTHVVEVPDTAQSFTIERTTPAPRTTTQDLTQAIDTTTNGYAGVYLWVSSDPNYNR